jgi:hypothetical protein
MHRVRSCLLFGPMKFVKYWPLIAAGQKRSRLNAA